MNTLAEVEHPDRRARDVINRLSQTELYRDFHRSYEEITSLPLGLRAAGSFQPPLSESRQVNPFCTLMAGRNATCAACLRVQQDIEEKSTGETATVQCFAGLTESVVPIRAGEQVLGYLQTGQVVHAKPSKARVHKVMAAVRGSGAPVDEKNFEAAYMQTRVLPRRQYEAAVRLLAIFGRQLTSSVNQAMVTEAASEPPAISKSRAYIAEHLTEELTLSQVARAANMSAFYFCKMFKRATGVTFTDYVARVRIEGVKSLLLKPHVRVSEAAFEVGFQSLSQFNRVFRRVVGESPSDYRDRLHRSALPPAAGHGSLVHAA